MYIYIYIYMYVYIYIYIYIYNYIHPLSYLKLNQCTQLEVLSDKMFEQGKKIKLI